MNDWKPIPKKYRKPKQIVEREKIREAQENARKIQSLKGKPIQDCCQTAASAQA
jgi:hypothetical protein